MSSNHRLIVGEAIVLYLGQMKLHEHLLHLRMRYKLRTGEPPFGMFIHYNLYEQMRMDGTLSKIPGCLVPFIPSDYQFYQAMPGACLAQCIDKHYRTYESI